jgi:hypothetical protein
VQFVTQKLSTEASQLDLELPRRVDKTMSPIQAGPLLIRKHIYSI